MPQELTAYELWQMEMYGDILDKRSCFLTEEELENGFMERNFNDRWSDDQQFFSLTEQEF